MGEYFDYVNHDKQIRFGIGKLGGADKFSGIGRNLGARAFCLLLTRSYDRAEEYEDTWVGSWIGDKVECIGDHGTLQDEHHQYQEVTANILRMLYQVDGSEALIEAAQKDDGMFLRIAHLIITNALPEISQDFEEAFGRQWGKRYKDICKKQPYLQVFDMVQIAPQNSG